MNSFQFMETDQLIRDDEVINDPNVLVGLVK